MVTEVMGTHRLRENESPFRIHFGDVDDSAALDIVANYSETEWQPESRVSAASDANPGEKQPDMSLEKKHTKSGDGRYSDACAHALGVVEDGAASLAIVDAAGRPLALEMMQRDPGGRILIQSRTGRRKGETYVACFSSSLPCPAIEDDPDGKCGERIDRPASGWKAVRLVIPPSSRVDERFKKLLAKHPETPERVSIPLENVPFILIPLGGGNRGR